ncbi:hypothetical protein LINPERHAP1_LOCUS20235 [Linum perenne]
MITKGSYQPLQLTYESVMREELKRIVEGIKLAWAWDKGIKKLRIQTDSKVAVQLLPNLNERNNQHASLIGNFRNSLLVIGTSPSTIFTVKLILQRTTLLSLVSNFFYSPNVSLQHLLRFDLFDVRTSHFICNNM